jgi:hypothetical protein
MQGFFFTRIGSSQALNFLGKIKVYLQMGKKKLDVN